MNSLYFFWTQLNWLEFVTYVLIPTAMVLVILTYIYFNIELLKLSFNFEIEIFDNKRNCDIEHFKFDFEYATDDDDYENTLEPNSLIEKDSALIDYEIDNDIDDIESNKN